MNAIVPIQPMPFGEMQQLALSIAKSNLFGMKTPDQALVLMSIAQAEGRHPALAARDYDIIQNRPAKKAEAMLRDFIEGGGKVEWHALTDEIADATFTHPQGGSVRISWDMKRAERAGLGKKDNYKAYPRQMLRSRTVSEGVRTVWPMATSGMHVPEEAADMPAREPPHNGPTLEHEPTSSSAPSSEAPKMDQGSRREAINRDVPLHPTPPPTGDATPPKPPNMPGFKDFLKSLEIAVRDCTSIQEVNRVIARPDTQFALATYKDIAARELKGILAEGVARWRSVGTQPDVPPADDDGDPLWPGDAPVTEPAGAG
jgi:hypothetical protein